MGMPQVLLVPGNPRDLTPEKLMPLVDDLSEQYTTDLGTVQQRGYGVTWWEVLLIYVASKGADAVVGRAFDELLDRLEAAVRAWLSGRRDQTENRSRPLHVAVYDEDGELIRALNFPVDGDPVDVTDEAREKAPRPRPKPSDDQGDPSEDK